jgi:hypothetical protein
LTSFHFGHADGGEKVYIQASLHADELPGMLAAWHLKSALKRWKPAATCAVKLYLCRKPT